MEGSRGSGGSRYELRSKKALEKVSGAEDLQSSPTPERAKKMEAVSVKRQVDYDTRFKAPDRTFKITPSSKAAFEKKCRECVQVALEHLNKSKKAKEVGGYELVEARGVSTFFRGMEGTWHHANFLAKPKNAPEAQSILFFAELNRRYLKPLKCVKCCVLGRLDYGSQGCKACEKYYPRLRHPQTGFHIGSLPYVLRRVPTNEEGCSA